jgi:hypothetical protein
MIQNIIRNLGVRLSEVSVFVVGSGFFRHYGGRIINRLVTHRHLEHLRTNPTLLNVNDTLIRLRSDPAWQFVENVVTVSGVSFTAINGTISVICYTIAGFDYVSTVFVEAGSQVYTNVENYTFPNGELPHTRMERIRAEDEDQNYVQVGIQLGSRDSETSALMEVRDEVSQVNSNVNAYRSPDGESLREKMDRIIEEDPENQTSIIPAGALSASLSRGAEVLGQQAEELIRGIRSKIELSQQNDTT